MRGTRRLSYVQRWGIVPKIRPQSVAEHSYYVALYTMRICDILKVLPEIKVQAVSYALVHDMAEAFTADIPSPLKKRLSDYEGAEKAVKKWMLGDTSNPDAMVKSIVKIADLLDAVVWLTEEESMGNGRLKKLRRQINGFLEQELDKIDGIDPAAKIENFVFEILTESEKGIAWYAE